MKAAAGCRSPNKIRRRYDSFTCFRFSRRALELDGRWPWLALVSFRLVLAIFEVPDDFQTSAGLCRIHIDSI